MLENPSFSYVYDIFSQHAKSRPDSTAIVCGDRRLSYAEIHDNVINLSRAFANMGLEPKSCIALYLPNTIEFVTAFLASSRLGATVLPVNHLYKENELQIYFSDCKPTIVITDLGRHDTAKNTLKKLKLNSKIVVTGDSIDEQCICFNTLLTSSEQQISDPLSERGTPSDTALFMYSSGSTGRPKQVPRSHMQIAAEVRSAKDTLKLTAADVILCTVPLYHAHGMGNSMLAALCNGGTLVLLKNTLKKGKSVEIPFLFQCPQVVKLIKEENVTILPTVPFVLKALVDAPVGNSSDFHSLRLAYSAGNHLSREVYVGFKDKFGKPPGQLYGCTEAGAVTINLKPDDDSWSSVGRPLSKVTIDLVDENSEIVEDGHVGELRITSPALTNGYLARGELNDDSFINGSFLTGDLARREPNGNLVITGRKRLLIDTGGRKVDPIEIEDILAQHPAIKEVVVVGAKPVGSSSSEEVIKAVIVQNKDDNLNEEQVYDYCRTRLTDFRQPKIIEFRDEIPKSPLGKILRKLLV